MKTVLSALLRSFKTKENKSKSWPGNVITSYYQITEIFESVISIQQHARNITGWPPGSKHGIQIEKSSSQRKNFHIRELKEKNKVLVYLAVLKSQQEFFAPFLSLFFGYLYKIEKKGTSCREKWLLSRSLQLPIREMDTYERK